MQDDSKDGKAEQARDEKPLAEARSLGVVFSLSGFCKATLFAFGMLGLSVLSVGCVVPFPLAALLGFIAGFLLMFDVAFKAAKSRTPWIDFAIMSLGFVVMILAAAYMLFPPKPDLKKNNIWCAGNLRLIGLAMKQYAVDNDGFFPAGDAMQAFESLRRLGYHTDMKSLVCPSAKPPPVSKSAPLTERNVSYVYLGSGLKDSPENADKPLVCDKPDNHKRYGNVLFCDGHVQGFSGMDWREQGTKGGK